MVLMRRYLLIVLLMLAIAFGYGFILAGIASSL